MLNIELRVFNRAKVSAERRRSTRSSSISERTSAANAWTMSEPAPVIT